MVSLPPKARVPLTWLDRGWLAAIVAVQLAMIVLMPAFNGPDERGHFIRMWALSAGHFSCDTLPASVREVDVMRGGGGTGTGWIKREGLRAYLARGASLPAHDNLVPGWDYECFYFPTGLVMPAIVTRLFAETPSGHVRPGGVFLASYAARLSQALMVDAALLFLLWSLPRLRPAALAFFSIPQVLQQSFCIGHDAFLLTMTLLVIVAALRPPSWRAVGAIALAVFAMAMLKPVYASLSLLALPMVVRLYEQSPFRRREWLRCLWLLAPAFGYLLLSRLSPDTRRMWHPGFANPQKQALYLLHHPLHLFQVFWGYLHYLVDDHVLPDFFPRLINGKWTTLFGVFGNAEFEMAFPGYFFVIAGLLLAFFAGVSAPPAEAPSPAPSRWLCWARRLAVLGALLPVPLTVLALYLVFSHIGADGPFGVQGRYHLPSMLLAMVLGVHVLRRRLRSGRARQPWPALLAAAALLAGNAWALAALYQHYWA